MVGHLGAVAPGEVDEVQLVDDDQAGVAAGDAVDGQCGQLGA